MVKPRKFKLFVIDMGCDRRNIKLKMNKQTKIETRKNIKYWKLRERCCDEFKRNITENLPKGQRG